MAGHQQLHELVTAVVATDDPTLLQRACFALDVILTEDLDRD